MASLLRLIPAAAALAALAVPPAVACPPGVQREPPRPGATHEEPPPGAAAGAPAPDLGTEEGLRAVLDAVEERYEAACRRLGEAVWRRALGAEGSGSAQVEAARRDLAAVFADAALDRAIAVWGNRRTVARDPTLTRRLRLWITTRVTAAVAHDPQVAALEESLADRLERGRVTIGSREVSRLEAERELEAADPAARRRAWQALSALARDARPDARKLQELRIAAVRAVHAPSYLHLVFDAQDLRLPWVRRVMETFVGQTQPAYDRLLAAMKEAMGGRTLQPWDLEAALAAHGVKSGAAAAVSAHLPGHAAPAVAAKLLEALGFKSAGLASTRVTPEPPLPGLGFSVGIPDDYRLLVGSHAALDPLDLHDWVLRRQGEALHAALTRTSSPMLEGYPWVPGARSGPYAQGMARTLAGFLRDPLFLRKVLGIDERAAGLIAEELRARDLLRLRILLRAMGMELILYGEDEAGPDVQYEKLTERLLGVRLDPKDPSPLYRETLLVLRPATSQDELLGGVIAAVVHDRLRQQLGDARFGSGRAAPWLTERLYADGETLPLHERIARAADAGFDLDPYLQSLGITPPAQKPTAGP